MTAKSQTILSFFRSTCPFLLGVTIVTSSYAVMAERPAIEYRADSPEVRKESGALAHYIMGSIYDNLGDAETAVSEYNEALSYWDGIAEIYLHMGEAYLVMGRIRDAGTVLEKAVSIDPEDVTPYLLLGIISTAKSDFPRAQKWYRDALDRDPENLKALTFLSDLYIAEKKLDKAAEIYEKIVKVRDDDPSVYFNLGLIYSKLNLLDKAEKNLQKAVEMDRSYLEAKIGLGFVYEVEGKYAEAINEYKKVSEADPANIPVHVRLGQLYLRMGETDKAIEENRVIIRLDPSSPEPYLRNFSIFASGKEYDKAEGVLKEALRNGVAEGVIYASLGYLAFQKGDDRKAVDNYTVALQKDPGNDSYRFYLAAALERTGDKKRAVGILEDMAREGTSLPEVYNYLGYTYAEEGRDLDRAMELVEKALSMDPGNGAYLDSLGWIYYKKGMSDKAVVYLERAEKEIPEDHVVKEHLGDVYFSLGRWKDAAGMWEKALGLDPGNVMLKKKLGIVKKRIGKER